MDRVEREKGTSGRAQAIRHGHGEERRDLAVERRPFIEDTMEREVT